MAKNGLENSMNDRGTLHVMWPELAVATGILALSFFVGSNKDAQAFLRQYDRAADVNKDGRITPDETIRVYDALGINHRVDGKEFAPKLSTKDMERYITISKDKERTTYK